LDFTTNTVFYQQHVLKLNSTEAENVRLTSLTFHLPQKRI